VGLDCHFCLFFLSVVLLLMWRSHLNQIGGLHKLLQ
jgi:hypothetical protein